MACKVIDRSIQVHGGLGVSQDTPLASFYVYARAIRLADGPDDTYVPTGKKSNKIIQSKKWYRR